MALHEYLALTLVAAGLVASIAVWTTVIARLSRGRPIIPLEPRRPVPWTFFDLALVMVAYFLFTSLGGTLLREFWHVDLPADLRELEPDHLVPFQLTDTAIRLATLVFAAVVVCVRTGASAADLGITPWRGRYDIVLGVVGFLALAAPVYSLQAILVYFFDVQHPLIDLIEARPDPWTFLVVGLSVSLVAPLSEEFLLRVLLQGWLERVVAVAAPGAFATSAEAVTEVMANAEGMAETPSPSDNPYEAPQAGPLRDQSRDFRTARAIPIVASALVFALLHMGHGPAPIPLFFLALGLGYLYQRTHRLWPSVVLHFLLNTSSLAMLWVEAG